MVHIDERYCRGCAFCIPNAPPGSIERDGFDIILHSEKCSDPQKCIDACPYGAIVE